MCACHAHVGSGRGLEILVSVAKWSKNIHSKCQVCSHHSFKVISVLNPKFGICMKCPLFSDPVTYISPVTDRNKDIQGLFTPARNRYTQRLLTLSYSITFISSSGRFYSTNATHQCFLEWTYVALACLVKQMQPGTVALSYICFGHVTYMFTLGIYTGSGSKPDTCQRSNLDLKPGLRNPPQDVVEPGLNADYQRTR